MLPRVSGELHYPRFPRASWRARLAMARAMGLEAISTYVFWNYHERTPGSYDFSGDRDVAHFVRLAREEGLDVVLRPGPYVCAEWEFGGFPGWLLAGGEIPIRTTDERFMAPVCQWLRRLGEELAPLQRAAGGPIVAVQLENEYGAFGADPAYLEALRAALDAAGFGRSPYFTIDQPQHLERGALDGVPAGLTFGPGDPERDFAGLRALRPGEPLFCGEYWAGWFDRWGRASTLLDDEREDRSLAWMLRRDIAVNVYMVAGGTNFGFWNGATGTDAEPYQPVTTSYDYQAAIDEAGRPTPKYHRFREIIARECGIVPPPIPAMPPLTGIAPFALGQSLPITGILGEPVRSLRPRSMEALGQAFGYTLYRTELRGPRRALLSIEDACDYTVIALNGRTVAFLDRRLEPSATPSAAVPAVLPSPAELALTVEGGSATLDILVENGGRINYGPGLGHDLKGLARPVRFGGDELLDWQIHALPLDAPPATGFAAGPSSTPAFYRGGFVLAAAATSEEPAIGDAFLDTRALHKGLLWVNGHHAGRYWEIGPQHALYLPGVWLRRGFNEVVALDLFAHERAPVLGPL